MPVFTRCPYPNKIKAGFIIFTTSQAWTVPRGLKKADIFTVGGGGAGGSAYLIASSNAWAACSAGGGGKTKTVLGASLTPGDVMQIIVGAGGQAGNPASGNTTTGGAGGASSFGSLCSADGGTGGRAAIHSEAPEVYAPTQVVGSSCGSGGSGAPPVGWYYGSGTFQTIQCGPGLDGSTPKSANNYTGGAGQGSTTRAFGEAGNTLYSTSGSNTDFASSGGAGTGASGAVNTGNGGSGGYTNNYNIAHIVGGDGGSGIVIIRWEEQ